MRILITASGIQDYIFNITERKASARLRGRSARLGLVTDLCLLRLQQEFGTAVEVKRNAGSRLEVEIPGGDKAMEFIENLRRDFDEHSRRDLNGEVWFAIGHAADQKAAYQSLDEEKLSIGKATLQPKGTWEPEKFVFDRWPSERALQDPDEADATTLPEAKFGRKLVERDNRLITFSPPPSADEEKLRVLDHVADVQKGQVYGGLCVALQDKDSNTLQQGHKHLARYAPTDDEGQLLDLDKIADQATGAKFLGVLKADMDGLGETFQALRENEKEGQDLSGRLEALFTDELENMIRSEPVYKQIYVVYSGGDDLFLLGPWDKLIRLIHAFHSHFEASVKADHPCLTLSAGFKLAHPKSPVRFLADDVETALDYAKGRSGKPAKLKAKNRIAVFERVIAWDELRDGLKWADRFIPALENGIISAGFLQRFNYYADQFRLYEAGCIDGLRMVPLLQDDWRRNRGRIDDPLRKDLGDAVTLLLEPMAEDSARLWRAMDFASRFAIYAGRKRSVHE